MAKGTLPVQGKPWSEVRSAMEAAKGEDSPWYSERAFRGGSYFASEDVTAVRQPGLPALHQHQRAVRQPRLPKPRALRNRSRRHAAGDDERAQGAIGSLTVGGTESILMAVKTARDWARDAHPQATAPEVIVPRAAHPGFDKSAHLMGFSAVRVPTSVDFRADVEAMRAAINPNTFMLVASAPSYPSGSPIRSPRSPTSPPEHGLWLHVDACHGGFIFPFARKLGYAFPITTSRCRV